MFNLKICKKFLISKFESKYPDWICAVSNWMTNGSYDDPARTILGSPLISWTTSIKFLLLSLTALFKSSIPFFVFLDIFWYFFFNKLRFGFVDEITKSSGSDGYSSSSLSNQASKSPYSLNNIECVVDGVGKLLQFSSVDSVLMTHFSHDFHVKFNSGNKF